MNYKKLIVVLLVVFFSVQVFAEIRLVPENQWKENELFQPDAYSSDTHREAEKLKSMFPKDVKIELNWYIVDADDLITGKLIKMQGIVFCIEPWDIYWTLISHGPARIQGRKFAVCIADVYDKRYTQQVEFIKETFYKQAFYEMIESSDDDSLKHDSIMGYGFPY